MNLKIRSCFTAAAAPAAASPSLKRRAPAGAFVPCSPVSSALRVLPLLLAASVGLLAGCATSSLNQAIVMGQTERANKLVAEKRSIDERDKLGNTPLHFSARQGDQALIGSLVAAGAAVDRQNNEGDTPLLELLKKTGYYPDATRLLLERRADPNRRNKDGLSPLLVAAGKPAHVVERETKHRLILSLIEHGADASQADALGRNALHHAALAGGPLQSIELLAAKLPDAGILTAGRGFNAYTLAVIGGHRDAARFLTRKGLQPQIIASPEISPTAAAPESWEVNPAAKINALAHEWYAVALIEEGGQEEAANWALAVAREQYALAVKEYDRALQECEAEIPRAKSQLARQKAGAVARNILGTAVGLATGINTGTGFVVYSTGGFSSKPDYLAWLKGEYDRELAGLKRRHATLGGPDLLASAAAWNPGRAVAAQGRWSDTVCVVQAYSATMDGKPLSGTTERDTEIKEAIDAFVSQLREAGIFAAVNPEDESTSGKQVTLRLELVEKQDLHTGAAVGKAFLTGFFTLGMFGNFTSGAYSYDTAVSVRLESADTEPMTRTARFDQTNKYSQNTSGAGAKAAKDARAEVTRLAFEEILAQLKRDAGGTAATR